MMYFGKGNENKSSSQLNSKKIIKTTFNILFPLVLGGGILYWMYRDFDFANLRSTFIYEMNWWWMGFSMIFGVSAQVFRGLRWRQTLAPLNENPRTMDCIHAIFLSYASSIIIPRIGEVARCGVLTKYDNTSFTKSLGTVVTERIIDSLLVMGITALVFLFQIKVFLTFFDKTGTNFHDLLSDFSSTGYIVTTLCLIATIALIYFVFRKLSILSGIKRSIDNIKAGIFSLKNVENKWLFTFYTLAIWGSYFLHYWITFKCFDFTENLGFTVAIVSFIVGSISVIVPTPNGAGPWHFAVKTILVLYGVAENNAVAFVLIVHTVQTALIPLLGVFSLTALMTRNSINKEQKRH